MKRWNKQERCGESYQLGRDIMAGVEWHLGWFHVFAILNSATMNMWVPVFLVEQFIFFWIYTQ